MMNLCAFVFSFCVLCIAHGQDLGIIESQLGLVLMNFGKFLVLGIKGLFCVIFELPLVLII